MIKLPELIASLKSSNNVSQWEINAQVKLFMSHYRCFRNGQTNNEADNFNEIEKNLNVQSSIEDIHIGEYLQMIQHWSLSTFIDYYDEM